MPLPLASPGAQRRRLLVRSLGTCRGPGPHRVPVVTELPHQDGVHTGPERQCEETGITACTVRRSQNQQARERPRRLPPIVSQTFLTSVALWCKIEKCAPSEWTD